MPGDIGSITASAHPSPSMVTVVSDIEFGRALHAGLRAFAEMDEDEAASRKDRHHHPRDAHKSMELVEQARSQAMPPAPTNHHDHRANPQAAAPYDHLDDILRHLQSAMAHATGPSAPGSRIDPVDPVFLAAMAQLGRLAAFAADQRHASRQAGTAQADAAQQAAGRMLLPAGLMRRIAAMPDRARGAAFATLMAAIDRMPAVNRTDGLRRLLDGERHGGLSSRSLATLWTTLNQARSAAAPADLTPDAAQARSAQAATSATAMPAPETVRTAASAIPDVRPANDAPAGVDTTGLARFMRDIDDRQRPRYLGLMLERTAAMPPSTRMALLRMALGQADRPGCLPILEAYVFEQPRLRPLERQGGIWSGMLRIATDGASSGASDDAALASALCRNLDLAIGQDDWPDALRRAGAMLACLPVEARPEPMRRMLEIAEHLPQPMRGAALAHLSSALSGLPDSDAAPLRRAIASRAASRSAAFATLPAATSMSPAESSASLPDPVADLRAFARALAAADYARAEDRLHVDGEQPGSGAAGRPTGVVVFDRPGHPRFHILMGRLADEHPALMEQDARGYRQSVERALSWGPVHVGMSPRFPWPSSCDRDAGGGCLISINPNLLDGSLPRIVTGLVMQMRRAALGAGDGAGLRGI